MLVQVFRDNTAFSFFSISNLHQIFISLLDKQIKNDLLSTTQVSDANLLKADQRSNIPWPIRFEARGLAPLN